MATNNNTRRDMGIIICVILGLVIGIFIKRVHIGLILGLAIGLLTAGLVSGRKRS